MKRILSLILVFVMVFLMFGCNQNEAPTEQPTEQAETPEHSETQGEPINKVRSTYKPSVKYGREASFYYTEFVEIDGGGSYSTFEEHIEEVNTTDIVKATYLGAASVYPICYFFFEIDEVLRGEIIDKTIAVPIVNRRYSFSIPDCPIGGYYPYTDYEVGCKYLLLIERYSMVHLSEEDIAGLTTPYLVIPLDNNGEPIVEQSLLYNQELLLHVESEEIKKQINDGKLIECILELTKDDAYKDSPVNITDKDAVIERADYVLNIEVESVGTGIPTSNLYSEYRCKLISASKGTVELQTGADSGYVYVDLTDSKVKIGGKYTVAVKKQAGKYTLISRNAIFPYTE